jgi:endo-1,4-beta-D-glucanase Y
VNRPAARRTALVAVLVVFSLAAPVPASRAAEPGAEAIAAGREFLDRYVDDDGRVVRRDEGGDTVSEGQAYALLIAVALEDREQFATIWSWTARHLQRPDGLLAWRWADGKVADSMPAADADLAAASALALAGSRFSNGDYLRQAQRIAAAIVQQETATIGGSPTLMPGPWAGSDGPVNVSYFMVNAMSRLLWATGDQTWAAIASSARRITSELTAGSVHLPPDWSTVAADGRVVPTRSPDGRSPRFGYEATRALVQLAVDCQPAGRQIAARAWPFFDRLRPGDIRAEYTLTGAPLVNYGHPLALVAAAASADAAGAHVDADELLDTATALDARSPTYYGAAWLALGRLWLDTSRLGGCRTP